MRDVEFRYAVGERVTWRGEERAIEARGRSINRLPVYLIGGTWVLERDLQPWVEPCPW